LGNTLKTYLDLLDDGYDDKFSTYERYTKEQVPDQINSFMASDKVDEVSRRTVPSGTSLLIGYPSTLHAQNAN
jgi:hypothetical protein